MNIFWSFVLVAAFITPLIDAKWSVGSLAKFQFHGKNDGEFTTAFAIVNENVTSEKVKDLLVEFNSTRPTKILIHGWVNSDKDEFATNLVESYVPKYDYNVITVDWCTEAFDYYPTSVLAVRNIGGVVAKLVDILVDKYNASLSNIHIIGHSLGAHVAGIAGLKVQSGKVGRITGLDPAHPLFSLTTKDRLRQESADFVDVIHTCGNFLSFADKLGHVDFYPNSGLASQPGCSKINILGGIGCSHSRAYQFFAESIQSPWNFVARKCNSWIFYKLGLCGINPVTYMGEFTPTSTRGSFYLDTNSESPFGRGT